MILVALVIGAVLIAAAIRGTQGQLFAALGEDLPPFVVWAAALVAVGAIGFIPGIRTPARLLLGLVIAVLILNNYQAILSGFAAVSTPHPATATPAGAASAQGATTSPPASGADAASQAQALARAAAGGLPDPLAGFGL